MKMNSSHNFRFFKRISKIILLLAGIVLIAYIAQIAEESAKEEYIVAYQTEDGLVNVYNYKSGERVATRLPENMEKLSYNKIAVTKDKLYYFYGDTYMYHNAGSDLYVKAIGEVSESAGELIDREVTDYNVSEDNLVIYSKLREQSLRGGQLIYYNAAAGVKNTIGEAVKTYYIDKSFRKIIYQRVNDPVLYLYNINDNQTIKITEDGSDLTYCEALERAYFISSNRLCQYDMSSGMMKDIAEVNKYFKIIKLNKDGSLYYAKTENIYEEKIKLYYNKNGNEIYVGSSEFISYSSNENSSFIIADKSRWNVSVSYNAPYSIRSAMVPAWDDDKGETNEKALIIDGRILGSIGVIHRAEISLRGDKLYYLKEREDTQGLYELYDLYEREINKDGLSMERLIAPYVSDIGYNCINNDPLYLKNNSLYVGDYRLVHELGYMKLEIYSADRTIAYKTRDNYSSDKFSVYVCNNSFNPDLAGENAMDADFFNKQDEYITVSSRDLRSYWSSLKGADNL